MHWFDWRDGAAGLVWHGFVIFHVRFTGGDIVMNESLSVKTVRKACLECSGGSGKYVLWCSCDGLHSTACHFWPFRLGVKPETFRGKYGDRLVNPEKMPPAGVELELLPDGFQRASTDEIDVPGYYQPAVEVKRKARRQMTPEQKEAIAERLRRGRESRRAG